MGPPKPKLVLRIGVTGHRPNIFAESAQLTFRQTLTDLFNQISTAAVALCEREAMFFDSFPPQICIVSALAEGTDRMVAEIGLQAGFALDAVLPFPVDIYETDFSTPASKTHYRGLLAKARARFVLSGRKDASDPVQASKAYEAVGLMMLRQCDLLVTVWDGKESSGRGGTEDIVQQAIASGRPVLRFDEKGNGPFLLMSNSIEPMDARDLAQRAKQCPEVDATIVTGLIEHLCAPPTPSGDMEKNTSKVAREASGYLKRYLGEKERRASYFAFSYPLILRVLGGKKGFRKAFRKRNYVDQAKSEWGRYLAAFDQMPAFATKPIGEILLPRFAWADNLANRYGQLHRSAYMNNFMLAAAAVLFAAARWSQVELAIILLIVILTAFGVTQRWHKRWVDYRQLSAELRQFRALLLTGSSTRELRSLHAGEEFRPGPLWVNWYFRMTVREIGVVNAKADAVYVESAREAISKGEIDSQIGYHEQNARRMKSIARWLDILGYSAFGITFIACACEVAINLPLVEMPDGSIVATLNILSIFLPAFGAALFGIRIHGDFEGSSERSADVMQKLQKVSAKFGSKAPMSFAELSALTEYAAFIMEGEIGDWGFVYRARPLALPT
jgi:hypothetical protein